ncbi:MAG: type III pantothenate kinase [Myxococcota bacterium]
MLLVIDIGNTNTVLGLYEGETLLEHWRIETAKGRTADEYGILILNLLQVGGFSVGQVDGVIMASVVPSIMLAMETMCTRYLKHAPLVVGPGIRTGMPILTDNPKEVGADRIVNAVAAFERHQQGCIVVDFGTATTFDCVSRKGEYLGGAISPGFQISAEALFQRTSKLPRIEITRPKKAIGKNTITSMQAGIFFGYVGLVDETVRRISEELGFKPVVISTGGLAPLFQGECTTIDEVDEHLTLRGLRILYERNRES